MPAWPSNPIIYEINTRVWLEQLTKRYGRPITLDSVPVEEWDSLGAMHLDAVWLMGVWERSELGRQIANETPALVEEFRRVLPDYTDADNVGSPYCVKRYFVDAALGGPAALAAARQALRDRGMRLVLDYVPNHVALDHPAVRSYPQYFIRGDREDLERDPAGFFEVEGHVIARGRDPNFPAWPDVAQINAFSRELRTSIIETVSSIADQCDGMRCDMAMLMMTDIFSRTWGDRAGEPPEEEFWPLLIGTVKQRHPDVLFLAEAYWDLEYALQHQGFDYCYDKRLYDRLEHEDAESVRGHLNAGLDYQTRLVRFVENHDEPRAAATLEPPERARAAALICATLPGARLLHQGQFEGMRTRIPVFLRRGPEEPVDAATRQFYFGLLRAIEAAGGMREGWQLCDVQGWDDNQSSRNILAWTWHDHGQRTLVAVNYSGSPAQAIVETQWLDLGPDALLLEDPATGQAFERDGAQLRNEGLFVDLPAWGSHFFVVSRIRGAVAA